MRTAAKVIQRCGGTKAVAKLTKKSVKTVYNWSATNRFPAYTYPTFEIQLKPHGWVLPKTLFPVGRKSYKRSNGTET